MRPERGRGFPAQLGSWDNAAPHPPRVFKKQNSTHAHAQPMALNRPMGGGGRACGDTARPSSMRVDTHHGAPCGGGCWPTGQRLYARSTAPTPTPTSHNLNGEEGHSPTPPTRRHHQFSTTTAPDTHNDTHNFDNDQLSTTTCEARGTGTSPIAPTTAPANGHMYCNVPIPPAMRSQGLATDHIGQEGQQETIHTDLLLIAY
jgi:hypothetical protein